jgi:ribosomal protein S18 acetylase RimI-like enzyme
MIQYERAHRLVDTVNAYRLLDGLENYYPEFGYWYKNRVMPGVMMGQDVLMLAREHGQVIGVGLGKRNDHETKLRCIRVLPEYQGRSVGIHLVEKMLRELDDDKPSCTVAEEMLHQFSRPFINLFKFDVSRVEKGLYRPGKLEYVFNG